MVAKKSSRPAKVRAKAKSPRSRTAADLLALPPDERGAFILGLTEDEANELHYLWPFWAREKQIAPPGDWVTWLILSGRGWGKTRCGAEWVRGEVEAGRCARLALVGPTAGDVRDVMVEGESGLLAICPPGNRPLYEPSKRRLTWPNGAIATTYSADEPDRLRGPQHDGAWADELATWRYPEAWDQLQFGLRLGARPRVVVTTTPRPTPIICELVTATTTHVTRGSTYENRNNLARSFFQQVIKKYEGTRLGRQELLAELLLDTPGALWTRDAIEALRIRQVPELQRIVVAIDPAVSTNADSDESGIIVAGIGGESHGFVLDDLSGIYTPAGWAKRAIGAFHAHKADCIVAEVNQGGDLVIANLRGVDDSIPVRAVRASRGKATRAEPISALYEQNRVHHVGLLPGLEDQMCTWTPAMSSNSPDRVDALVWALTELMLGASWGDDDEGIIVCRRSRR